MSNPLYVNRLENDVKTLREQVEKLTNERDEAIEHDREACRVRNEAIRENNETRISMGEQLAALAEQNEKMRKMLETISNRFDWAEFPGSLEWNTREEADNALASVPSLPDLASPVLNRIRAEGMEIAADICHVHSEGWRKNPGANPMAGHISASNCEHDILARAAELRKAS